MKALPGPGSAVSSDDQSETVGLSWIRGKEIVMEKRPLHELHGRSALSRYRKERRYAVGQEGGREHRVSAIEHMGSVRWPSLYHKAVALAGVSQFARFAP